MNDKVTIVSKRSLVVGGRPVKTCPAAVAIPPVRRPDSLLLTEDRLAEKGGQTHTSIPGPYLFGDQVGLMHLENGHFIFNMAGQAGVQIDTG